MSLLPATVRAAAPDDEPISFVPVGHLFPTVRGDDFANDVAGLVAEGWDQWAASYFVHTGEMPLPPPPPWDADRATWSTWCGAWVEARFSALARWVGLR